MLHERWLYSRRRFRRFLAWIDRYSNIFVLVLTIVVCILTWVVLHLTYISVAGQDLRFDFVLPCPASTVSGTMAIEGVVAGELLSGTFDRLFVQIDGQTIHEQDQHCESGETISTRFDTRAVSDGPHVLRVLFVDGHDVRRISSTQVFVDNTPPVILIDSPQDGQVVCDSLAVVAEVVGAERRPTMTLDSVLRLTSNVIDTSEMSEGEHQIRFESIDTAGNMAFADVRFTVDRTCPSLQSLGVPMDTAVSGVYECHPQYVEPNAASFDWTIDGVTISADPVLELDTLQFGDGEHTLGLRLTDAVGQSRRETAQIQIDNTPILIARSNAGRTLYMMATGRIDLCPRDATRFRSTSHSIGGDSERKRIYLPLCDTEPKVRIEYFVDGESTSRYIDLSHYDRGDVLHAIVRVTDPAGNPTIVEHCIQVESSLRALLGWMDYEPPLVYPDGRGEFLSPNALPAPTLSVEVGLPMRMGLQIDQEPPPLALGIGLDTELGLAQLCLPLGSKLGIGVKWRTKGLETAGRSLSEKFLVFNAGVSPLLFAPLPTEPCLDSETHVFEECMTYWLRFGVADPLIQPDQISTRDSVNLWITLGAELQIAVSHAFKLELQDSGFRATTKLNSSTTGQFRIFVGFDISFLP